MLILYDLRTSQFLWQYTGERNDKLYLKQDIDTCLSQLGYWEGENGIYISYDSVLNLKNIFIYQKIG
jgi:virulence-associated protein VapD